MQAGTGSLQATLFVPEGGLVCKRRGIFLDTHFINSADDRQT